MARFVLREAELYMELNFAFRNSLGAIQGMLREKNFTPAVYRIYSNKLRGAYLRWPDTVLARAFADAI